MRSRPEEHALLDDVFEQLPQGIAVTDRVGTVLVRNGALEEILGPSGAVGKTCCELFGCDKPGGPPGGCLTKQAIRAGGSPVEVVLAHEDGVPLWATVAPLRDDGSRLVFEVRRAPKRPLPLPPAAVAGEQVRLQIFTLGRTEVVTSQGPLSGGWLDQRAGLLLKYLTCERHRVVPTEEIAESVCNNAQHSTPNTVRYFIHALRKWLEPGRPKHGQARVVLARHGGYTLNKAAIWIDADEFEAQVNVGLAALARGSRAAASDHFERAVALYQGDFLADEPYAEWALMERERLRALVEKPLRALSELHADDPERAAGYLARLAQMEPLDGDVQRELLSLWVRQGRVSRAARHYHAFQQRLLRELGTRPEFSLSEIVLGSGTG